MKIEIQTTKDEVYLSDAILHATEAELRKECEGLHNTAMYSIKSNGKIHAWRGEDIFRMSVIL